MKKVFTLIAAILALTCMACKGTIVDNSQNHTVTFQTNGADSISSKSVEDGEKVSEPDPAPQKNGYDFMGWYTDSSFTTKYDFDTPVTSNITLYAKWQIQTFSIVFDTNGGSAVETQIVEYDKTVAIPANPTKDGYEFGGWYLGKDFETARKFNFATKIHGNYKLYAKWVEKTQQNNPDDQSNITNPDNQENEGQGTQAGEDEEGGENNEGETNNEGEVSNGGGTNDEGETNESGGKTDPVDPTNLEDTPEPPKPVMFKVTFETSGGTAITQVQVQDGERVAEPQTPVKEGYTFGGWYSDSSFTDDSKYDFNNAVFGNTTLYAKWTILNFTVIFVVQNDPDSPTQVSQKVNYKETVTKPSDPEKEGYIFGGWYADEELNTAYNFDTLVTAPVTIYAKWTIKTFKVDFIVQDNQINIPSQQINYNGKVTRPLDPEKEGYIFSGWYADEGLNTTYNFDTPVTKALNIYAKWTIKSFTINFVVQDDPDSPTQITIPSQQINYNEKVTKPVDPQQQNAEFRGWYSDSKFKTSYDFNTAVKNSFTLYGHLYEFPIEDINYASQQVKNSELTDSPYPQTYQYPKYNWTANGSSQGTVIDGLGKFYATCNDIEYSVNVDGNRKIELKKLSITAPSALENVVMGIKIHVENGTRNGTNAFETTENILLSSTKEIITIQNTELNNYLNQKQKLYFEITYTFTYNNKNYEYLVFKNANNKWYQDPGVITGFGKYPLVKIVSTANGGSNRFVTEPKSRHIKNQWGDSNVPDPYYVECKITAGNVVDAVGKVKVRGNYTTSYAKKSLRIKFDKKQSMFGVHNGEKFKSWVLLSVFKDASLLRDATAFKMFHEMFPDYYASDAQLVEVVLNGTYMGVYLLAEQQQTNKKRVNISEAEENSPETQIGYLLEFDNYYDTEELMNRFEIHYPTDIKDYADNKLTNPNTGYTIKSDVYSMDQRNFIMNYMNNLWKICYEAVDNHKYYKFNYEYRLVEYTPEGATQDEKCQNCINRVIDTKSLANMYIFSEITCDPDLYWSSFYMDIDFAEGADKKLRFEAPWDFDSTMGNKSFAIQDTSHENTDKKNMSKINEMFAGSCQTDVNCHDERIHGNPWMMIFINQTWFKNLVKEQWANVNVAALKSSVSSFIDTNSSGEYTIAFELNRDKWGNPSGITELCYDSATAAAQSQAASAEYFKNWLTARIDAVNTIINGLQ